MHAARRAGRLGCHRGTRTFVSTVGCPAPTGPGLILNVRPGQRPHDGCPQHAPISALARGTQPRDALAFDNKSKPFDARCKHHPHRVPAKRRRSPDDSITSNAIDSGPEGRTTVTTDGLAQALVTLKSSRKAMANAFSNVAGSACSSDKRVCISRIPSTKTFTYVYMSMGCVMIHDFRCRAICT